MSGSAMPSTNAGSSVPCPDCIKCDPDIAVTSFPLNLGIAPTETLYDSVDEPITMNFQWATRSIAPQFTSVGASTLDEGTAAGATNVSTLNFNNKTYSIYSVQICAATHNGWLIPPSSKSSNTEDMIITFYNPNVAINYNYVLIVIAIIRVSSAVADPVYLSALSSQTQGSFSISSCLPNKNARFAYYSSCIDGYTAHKTPETIYVFVAVEGLPVSSALMGALSKKANAGGNFPNVTLPFILTFASQVTTVSNDPDSFFGNYVLTTRHLLDYTGIRNAYKDMTINKRTDTADAYKCVPLDPDKDVVGGNIEVDLESGQLLSAVLAERAAVRSAANVGPTGASKSKLQAYLGSALGILCAILIFSILLYFIITWSMGSKASTGQAAPTAPTGQSTWIQQIPLYGIMTIIAGLVGFTVGAMVS